MIPEHDEIIKKALDDAFALRDEFTNHQISTQGQLKLAQLSLFQFISGAIIAIIAIGYVYNAQLNYNFLPISAVFATFTLIFSVSISREIIDQTDKELRDTREFIDKKTQKIIDKILESYKKDNSEIYFEFLKNETGTAKNVQKVRLNYAGETVLFCFYSSIGFYILTIAPSATLPTTLFQAALVLFISLFLSFKNWAYNLSEFLSRDCFSWFKPSPKS